MLLNSCWGWLDSYLNPSLLLSPSQPSQGSLNYTPGAPKTPNQSLETAQNNPNTAAFYITLFWMVKIMLWQLLLIATPTPLHEFISSIPRNPESHIWRCLSPHQSLETIQNTLIHDFIFYSAASKNVTVLGVFWVVSGFWLGPEGPKMCDPESLWDGWQNHKWSGYGYLLRPPQLDFYHLEQC